MLGRTFGKKIICFLENSKQAKSLYAKYIFFAQLMLKNNKRDKLKLNFFIFFSFHKDTFFQKDKKTKF
jgi:hypothetical protein